jgi:hypothetical protein
MALLLLKIREVFEEWRGLFLALTLFGILLFGVIYGGLAFELRAEIVVAVVAGIVAAFTSGINMYYRRKQNQLTGLLAIFERLDEADQRMARRQIADAFTMHTGDSDYSPADFDSEDYKLPGENILKHENIMRYAKMQEVEPEKMRESLKLSAEKSRAMFDQIGSLVKHNLIPKHAFFEVYWNTIVRTWGALKPNIDNMRSEEMLSNKDYMSNFQALVREAVKYWKTYHRGQSIHYYPDSRPDKK